MRHDHLEFIPTFENLVASHETTCEESNGEISNSSTKESCKNDYKALFKPSSRDSHDASWRILSKKIIKEEHVCFKDSYEEDKDKVNTLSYR